MAKRDRRKGRREHGGSQHGRQETARRPSAIDWTGAGATRTARPTPATAQRRRRFGVPPWLPVAGIAAIIGVIIALFFFLRATTAPAIGDHIHGALEIYIWGQKQPDIGGDRPGMPTWESGTHTHGDGLIHLHPQVSSEEGAGAALGRWFESGGMKLTKTTLRLLDGQEYNNGDVGPDATCPRTATACASSSGRRDHRRPTGRRQRRLRLRPPPRPPLRLKRGRRAAIRAAGQPWAGLQS